MTDPTVARVAIDADHVMLIDRADLPLLDGFNLHLHDAADGPYARVQRRKLRIYVHRLVIGAGESEITDHVNGDTLDNRSGNLRITDTTGNNANRAPNVRNTTSPYKGVSWDRERSAWYACISLDNRTVSLGRHSTEEAAALAYNTAAIAAWGELARLNVVEGG